VSMAYLGGKHIGMIGIGRSRRKQPGGKSSAAAALRADGAPRRQAPRHRHRAPSGAAAAWQRRLSMMLGVAHPLGGKRHILGLGIGRPRRQEHQPGGPAHRWCTSVATSASASASGDLGGSSLAAAPPAWR
jgi:hypothetical protein